MSDETKTYQDGLVEGKFIALESMMDVHAKLLDGHEERLRLLERVCWGLFGIVVAMETLPYFLDWITRAT